MHISKILSQPPKFLSPIQLCKALAVLLLICIFMVPAFGTNLAHASAPKKEGAMANPLSVEITGIVVPVARDRRLVNYAFMSIMIYTADDRSANLVRANMFLIKDAIVRATSRAPIVQNRSAAGFDVIAFARQIYPVVQSSIAGIRVARIEIISPEMMRR